MFEVHASDGDFCLEKLSFRTKDNKATNVKVYFKLGPYRNFPKGGRNRNDWGRPAFIGVPYRITGGYREVKFREPLVIPGGGTGSIYLESKKDVMFVRGRTEFARADGSKELGISTGSAFKKPFGKKSMNADFVGVMTYHTYRKAKRVTLK